MKFLAALNEAKNGWMPDKRTASLLAKLPDNASGSFERFGEEESESSFQNKRQMLALIHTQLAVEDGPSGQFELRKSTDSYKYAVAYVLAPTGGAGAVGRIDVDTLDKFTDDYIVKDVLKIYNDASKYDDEGEAWKEVKPIVDAIQRTGRMTPKMKRLLSAIKSSSRGSREKEIRNQIKSAKFQIAKHQRLLTKLERQLRDLG